MKYAMPLLLLVVGGCAAKTLTPEDFLYAYRCGAMPGQLPANSAAVYLGRQDAYHFVELHSGRPSDTFMYGITGIQKVRCLAKLLPLNFPDGFDPLRGTEAFESSEDTRQYVKEYLARHPREKTPRPGVTPSPYAKDPDDDPGSN